MKTTLLSILLVIATIVSNGQWSYTDLLIPREYIGCAAVGNKVYFAGGSNDDGFWGIVEVYDLSTDIWSMAGNLSVQRQLIGGTTTCGSKIFFAGGFDFITTKNVVDIYDTQTQQWSVEYLSEGRLSIAAVSHGSKVLFAGGFIFPAIQHSDRVDIYDTLTGEWELEYLSIAREGMASAVVGDLAIFAGGVLIDNTVTSRVDIWNFSNETWEDPAELSEARGYASATTVGSKVIIGGGVISNPITPSNVVDIYDASDGSWSTTSLSIPRSAINNAVTIQDKAYFAGGGTFIGGSTGFLNPQNRIDIYDPEIDTWTIDSLSEPLVEHAVAGISIGLADYLIVGGGKNGLGEIVSTVEIFKDLETGIKSKPDESLMISVYPNPCNNILTINSPRGVIIKDVVIYSQTGQKVHQEEPVNNSLDILGLGKGIYIIELKSNQGKIREKLIVH